MEASRTSTYTGQPAKTEDQFTKTVEDYTAEIPSSAYLGIALGAMGLSLVCQAMGQGKWGNFIAQWVPTWLIIGVYNKLVKLEGHDQRDRATGYSHWAFGAAAASPYRKAGHLYDTGYYFSG
jgi:hypothetical protein